MTDNSPRLFIALPIPQKTKDFLSQGLYEYADYIEKSIPPSNWHITVCFLGNVENHEQYLEALTKPLPQSFLPTVTVTHVGRGLKKDLLWAYVNSTSNLNNLKNAIISRLKNIDLPFPEEKKEFIPHITLASFSKEYHDTALADKAVNITWPVKEAILYKSISTDSGVNYESLSSIPFTN